MTTIVWDAPGEKLAEAGVDRGVFYPQTGPGVAWNGLVNVTRLYSNAEINEVYIDGQKWASDQPLQEFRARIQAFTYPEEFEYYDGIAFTEDGIGFDNQLRHTFGFSYRTKIANDLEGTEHGYKLHIVYNALATPEDTPFGSFGSSVDVTLFSWNISTTPIQISGFRPTAHVILDSRRVDPAALSQIENELYGTPTTTPKLIQPSQLLNLLGSDNSYPATNLFPNSALFPTT